MVTFLSVFLGLVAGVQPVEIAVGGAVVAVELRLDGRSVGTLRGEPWTLACDFGSELAPHQLVAIGRDAGGRELARAEQWINLPRPRSQVELVLEEDPRGPPASARLLWHSVDGSRPDAWEVTFDGEPLVVADPRRIELPAYDPATVHLLQAELRFGHTLAHTEITVGGPASEVIGSALTAFPVFLRERRKPPSVEEMKGWFVKDGRPLRVVAVERGPADLVMVQDQSPELQGDLLRLRREILSAGSRRPMSARQSSGLKNRDRLRVIVPVGEMVNDATQRMELFPISIDFGAIRQGPRSVGVGRRQVAGPTPEGILAAIPYPPPGTIEIAPARQRLADAVAVAGQAAAAGRRPRAVVLIAGREAPDESAYDPAAVRGYLRKLHVPLVVWSPEVPKGWDTWGEAREIGNRNQLFHAVGGLRSLLDRQLMVWLERRHLPQEVALSPAGAAHLGLLGDAPAELPEGEPEIETWTADAQSPEAVPAPAVPEAAPSIPVTDPAASFVDTVEVHVVNVEVVVSDREGRRIRDLAGDDFELYEDGQRMEITHFLAPPAVVASGESGEEIAVSPLHLVVVLDVLHLRPSQRRQVTRALREVLAGSLPARVMLVTYDGTARIRQAFTGEPSRVSTTLAEIGRDAGRPAHRDRRSALVAEIALVKRELDDANDRMARRVAESHRNSVVSQLRLEAETAQRRTRETLDVLQQFVLSLGGVEGRKALLYVGDRLELEPAKELYVEAAMSLDLEERELARLESEARSFHTHRRFEEMLRQANANGVTFYALAPPGRGDPSFGERATAGALGFQGRIDSTLGSLVRDAVCLMSDTTGGLCQAGGSELRPFLEEAVDDFGASYSLAYTPERRSDGKFHKLEVRVNRPGLSVRHRQGFLDKPPEDRLRDRLAAALLFDAEEDALAMELRFGAEQRLGQGGSYLVPLEVEVLVKRLALVPLPEPGQRGAKARLLVVMMAADGRVSGVQEYPISFRIREGRLAEEPPLSYVHKVHLTLASGAWKVGIGLWDEIGRGGSFLSREVDVGGQGAAKPSR
ncbi:MAG: VWA domain-containing protein [bacterium]|nr:VWA domain-containing protein [bacterium]